MRTLFLILLHLPLLYISAQSGDDDLDLVPVIISGGSTYLSRYNLRIRLNNSYQGLRYVEISGQLDPDNAGTYDASFWHASQTTRDLRTVSVPIDRVQRQTLSLAELSYEQRPLSATKPEHLHAFPEYRNFPLLPSAVLYRLEGPGIPQPGFSYEAFAYRLTDPDGDGVFTPVQVYVLYTYRGVGEYLQETVHFFDADFALRSNGRFTGFTVQGSNRVRIAIFPGDETRIFMNNTISENYALEDGSQIGIEGFGLTWIRSASPIYENPGFLRGIVALSDTEHENPGQTEEPGNAGDEAEPPAPLAEKVAKLLPLPERIESAGGDIEISADPLGLKLNLPNIQFEPDSTTLLRGEPIRIETLAEILRKAPDRRFLIVGHTADVGRPQGQRELSLARAERIAQLLAAEGIPPGAMRYEGRGGTEALGDNATEDGRARNRRVEVIILN